MLRRLSIRDIVLIEALDLDFAAGLNVLTGETGAGKSILLDALGLALGGRGGSGLTRAGTEQGQVTAVFEVAAGHPALAQLRDLALPDHGDGQIILRRHIGADGRGRVYVNDQAASVGALRAVADTLVEVHGQHDDRGLLNPAGHRAILDDYADLTRANADCRRLYREWQSAKTALSEKEAAIAAARRDADYIRHSVAELQKLAPEPGEEEQLDAARRLMQMSARLSEDVARAQAAVGAQGAEGMISDAFRRLTAAADKAEGRLDAAVAALERVLVELDEASRAIDRAAEAMRFNPRELEQIEERLFALRALARKHQITPAELPKLRDRMAARMADLEQGEAEMLRLSDACAQAEAAWRKAATALHAARQAAAARLDAAVMAELAPLKMERARFQTLVEAIAEPGPEGFSRVQFQVATNPGSNPGALDKIASGGELSRFLLALKMCLVSGAQMAPCMVFDEIDRGVGGATADAVGARLQRLAKGGQVLVVTHSPQVAARANQHFRIEKQVEGGVTRTHVSALSPDERIEEIARMLSGEVVTLAARVAAKTLLQEAE